MDDSRAIYEFYRLISQLEVKANLYVAYGHTREDKEHRANALNNAIREFIKEYFSDFRPEGSCSPPCHWDAGLELCVCNGWKKGK